MSDRVECPKCGAPSLVLRDYQGYPVKYQFEPQVAESDARLRAAPTEPSAGAIDAAFKASWHASGSMSSDDMRASLCAAYAVDGLRGAPPSEPSDAAEQAFIAAAEKWYSTPPRIGGNSRVRFALRAAYAVDGVRASRGAEGEEPSEGHAYIERLGVPGVCASCFRAPSDAVAHPGMAAILRVARGAEGEAPKESLAVDGLPRAPDAAGECPICGPIAVAAKAAALAARVATLEAAAWAVWRTATVGSEAWAVLGKVLGRAVLEERTP